MIKNRRLWSQIVLGLIQQLLSRLALSLSKFFGLSKLLFNAAYLEEWLYGLNKLIV